jgi:hypothetical protein
MSAVVLQFAPPKPKDITTRLKDSAAKLRVAAAILRKDIQS